jgi:uncharacterized cupredoxin-like copper-binding protein
MKKLLLTIAFALALSTPTFAAGTHEGGHGDEMSAGVPGDAGHIDRTIEVTMTETDDGQMLYEPRTLDIRKGETVKLIITNAGEQEHEFVLDTVEKNQNHKVMMEKMGDMEHDDPNAIRLDPGATGEIVWTFSNSGTFEYACLILGHYEAGMHGPVAVN